jgi:hypothetical protein
VSALSSRGASSAQQKVQVFDTPVDVRLSHLQALYSCSRDIYTFIYLSVQTGKTTGKRI